MPKEYIEMEAVIEKNHGGVVYIDDIKNIPAADVDPVRHGRWNVEWDAERDPKRYFVRIVCSNCGLKTGQKSSYCPNCGAKMDLEDT